MTTLSRWAVVSGLPLAKETGPQSPPFLSEKTAIILLKSQIFNGFVSWRTLAGIFRLGTGADPESG
jgi:hypothetical protein